jgi:hypothetical protein
LSGSILIVFGVARGPENKTCQRLDVVLSNGHFQMIGKMY